MVCKANQGKPCNFVCVRFTFRVPAFVFVTRSLRTSAAPQRPWLPTRVARNVCRPSRGNHAIEPPNLAEIWLVKNGYPKWNPCKRNQGLKPAIPWRFNFDPHPNVSLVCRFLMPIWYSLNLWCGLVVWGFAPLVLADDKWEPPHPSHQTTK